MISASVCVCKYRDGGMASNRDRCGSVASALQPCDQRVLVGFVIEQLRADALLGIRVEGLGRLVDLEVGIELLAGECKLTEAIGIERVRGDVDAGFTLAIEKRDRASVAIRSNERMHDDFGERLRV